MRKLLVLLILIILDSVTKNSVTLALETNSLRLPTKETPLIINEKERKVLIYTEVQKINLQKYNTHWGVVFRDGKLSDKAILKAYVNHLEFHDALLKIGAKAGNTLSKDSIGKYVEGTTLDVKAVWEGLKKEASLEEIFEDTGGKGFQIKFGGNRKAAAEQNTGCITCLESCWVAITSNAKYPQTSSFKRFISPNARFRGKVNMLPGDGTPVILIYRVEN